MFSQSEAGDQGGAATHHGVAGLEDLAEQDATLPLGKRLSEGAEAAGVSDVRTVDTLSTWFDQRSELFCC